MNSNGPGFTRAGVSYKHQAALTTTPQIFTLTKDATNAPPSAPVPTYAEFKQINFQLDTLAGGATSVNFAIAADAAGDILLTPTSIVSINTGTTTATKGVAIGCLEYDYHYQQLAVETVGTVYLVAWLNAGTANCNARLHWRA